MVADMYQPEDQGYPLAYIVLSSVGGSALGPIFGGLIETHLYWRWNFWIQLIL
jgi:MFS family permease